MVEFPPHQYDIVARWFARYGFLGVDIFFPLSGFLIARYLLESKSPDRIRVFFLRRAFRIMPLYFLALSTFFLASLIVGVDSEIIHRIWINALFLTGWFIFGQGLDSVPYTLTWSLSVEEFAYLLLGLSALVGRQFLKIAIIFICIAPLILRLILNFQSAENLYYFPLTRVDSIAMGALMALLLKYNRALLLVLPVLLAFLYIMSLTDTSIRKTLLFTMISLATCFIILLFESIERRVRFPQLIPLAKVGFYSYFIYLFHYFNVRAVMMLVDDHMASQFSIWIVAGTCFVLTLIQAIVSFHVFEGPMMAFGRRLERRTKLTR